jgi:toxin ParE1/3/4
MKLFWTPQAVQNRIEIYERIEADSPRAALNLDEMFSERANSLIVHPALGKPGRVLGTRELVVHSNYILVYDQVGDAVRILQVLHVAKRWPPPRSQH